MFYCRGCDCRGRLQCRSGGGGGCTGRSVVRVQAFALFAVRCYNRLAQALGTAISAIVLTFRVIVIVVAVAIAFVFFVATRRQRRCLRAWIQAFAFFAIRFYNRLAQTLGATIT